MLINLQSPIGLCEHAVHSFQLNLKTRGLLGTFLAYIYNVIAKFAQYFSHFLSLFTIQIISNRISNSMLIHPGLRGELSKLFTNDQSVLELFSSVMWLPAITSIFESIQVSHSTFFKLQCFKPPPRSLKWLLPKFNFKFCLLFRSSWI